MKIRKNFEFGGWKNCICLSNGEIEIVATTDVGPRVVRFGFLGEQNFFKEFKDQQGKTGGDEWLSYGGHRFWHAPEAVPRTYHPDNNQIKYTISGETLKLTQDVEKTTGIQKEIEISPGQKDNSVRVLHRLVNKNMWEIVAAPWALTVMAEKGRAIIPQEPYKSHYENLLPVRPIVLWSYTDMKDPRWIWGTKFIQVRQDPGLKTSQKFGALNTLGWAAYSLNDQLFVKRYDYNPEATYTDFGVNTEVYTDSNILEIETLGSFGKIPPGGFVEHIERWFLFKATLSEDEDPMESTLAEIIKKTY